MPTQAVQLTGSADSTWRLTPLATPLMTSGIPANILRDFEPVFRANGMLPLQAGATGGLDPGRGTPPAKLEPGSAIAVPLLSGDGDVVSIGTVTEVLGDRVMAFGHAFNSEGEVSLPMGSGYIHHVVASLSSSFKIGAFTQLRGTLQSDQLVGISGKTGIYPQLVPVEIRCVYADGSVDSTYKYSVVQHPRFTPMMAAMVTAVAASSPRELPQYHTVDWDVNLEFGNGQSLHVVNRSANTTPQELFQAVALPIQAAMENPFDRVALKKMTAVVRVNRQPLLAEIASVSLPRTKYRPGETLKAFVTYRPFRAAEAILPIEFELPRDLPDAQYDFAVLDWQQHLQEEQTARPFRFTADNTAEVFAALRDLTGIRHDALYVRLLRQPDGVAIGRVAMPRLPSSRRRVMLGAGASNTAVFASTILKVVSTDCVMTGAAHFTITIDKEAKVDVAARPAAQPPAPKSGKTAEKVSAAVDEKEPQ